MPEFKSIIPKRYYKIAAIVALALLFAFYYFGIRPPAQFPIDSIAEVNRGETLSAVANKLAAMRIIQSPFLYKVLVTLASPGRGVIAGDYVFDRPTSLFGVVVKTTDLLFGIGSVRVTVYEGMNNKQLADMLALRFNDFDKAAFIKKAAPYEGYLFPDTYIFAKGASEDEIIRAMNANFVEKTKELRAQAEKTDHSWAETVTMASILEREARTAETRKTISGILWKRIDNDVPLQVDAVFYYLYGKATSELTTKDLLVDSPYNVYKNKGLPPGPIANPGLEAIADALSPKQSNFWYFLSDRNGVMHYATTYEAHLANKRRYLD